jgi:hypothetical protein
MRTDFGDDMLDSAAVLGMLVVTPWCCCFVVSRALGAPLGQGNGGVPPHLALQITPIDAVSRSAVASPEGPSAKVQEEKYTQRGAQSGLLRAARRQLHFFPAIMKRCERPCDVSKLPCSYVLARRSVCCLCFCCQFSSRQGEESTVWLFFPGIAV